MFAKTRPGRFFSHCRDITTGGMPQGDHILGLTFAELDSWRELPARVSAAVRVYRRRSWVHAAGARCRIDGFVDAKNCTYNM